MLMTDLHGDEIATDCGNFEPKPNVANGDHFCRHCPGWRIWHEPWRTEARIQKLTHLRQSIDNLFADATTLPLFRARLIGLARGAGWLALPVVPKTEADPDRYRTLYTVSSPWQTNQSPGAPDLLFVGQDRTRVLDPTDAGARLIINARPGGLLAIWLSSTARRFHDREIDWVDGFGPHASECHLWTPDDLAFIVHRLTGNDLTEVLP